MNVQRPTLDDWEKLSTIVNEVERIVSDAKLPMPGQDFWPFPKPPDLPATASKLANASALGKHIVDQVVAALPGVESLGTNRGERLAELQRRLSELLAYRWLSKQPTYADALSLIKKKAAQKGKKNLSIGEIIADGYNKSRTYGKDTSEFLLLQILIQPLKTYFLYLDHIKEVPFPTKVELEKAFVHARYLKKILREKFHIYEVMEVPPTLEKALDTFVKSVNEKLPSYVKPKENKTLKQRLFADELIKNCWEIFFECSPTLLKKLLALVDYHPDDSDLSKRIKILKSQFGVGVG